MIPKTDAMPSSDVSIGGTQYFARDHLRMAKFVAEACEQHCTQDGITGIDIEVWSYAVGAIVESTVFLEDAMTGRRTCPAQAHFPVGPRSPMNSQTVAAKSPFRRTVSDRHGVVKPSWMTT